VELETWPDVTISMESLQRQIWFSAQNLLGDPGSADAVLEVVRGEIWAGGGEALVQVRRGEVDRARAAIACVDSIEDDPVRITVRGVSGTIRAGEEKYIRGPSDPPREEQVVFDEESRTGFRTDDLVDISVSDSFVGATHLDLE
jgi:ribonuclease P/MRP protein subunit POP5